MIARPITSWAGSAGGSATSTIDGGGALGDVYLFNKRTGKVYLHFDDCGEGRPGGCFGPLTVLEEEDSTLAVTPQPQSHRAGSSN